MERKANILELEGVRKKFGRQWVVDGISLSVKDGELLTLLGPSGCGKTTLLRLIAGFETLDGGSIVMGDRQISSLDCHTPPEARTIGMVFQDYALFPHLTVWQNVSFGLQKYSRSQQQTLTTEAIALVGLSGLEKRYPHQLSGGQQQRIALARALAPRPPLILLDEPLSNLDVQVRLRLRYELRHILKKAGIAAIFVTHDQEEALSISDHVAVLNQGKLEQWDMPEQIYRAPRSRFVAEFVTQANFLTARRSADGWITELGLLPVHPTSAISAPESDPQQWEISIRPEEFHLRSATEPSDFVVCDRAFLGRDFLYSFRTPSGQELTARSSEEIAIGSAIAVSVLAERVQSFPKTSS
ncbi:MAG: ABC transporter ATP-binding protein [Oscillatoriales cyanobacterium SM2_2_1]|nr:ABC transporter ATP-binding protein [Oscillatoriales cyanobacterium SM2_2_1]